MKRRTGNLPKGKVLTFKIVNLKTTLARIRQRRPVLLPTMDLIFFDSEDCLLEMIEVGGRGRFGCIKDAEEYARSAFACRFQKL